MKNALQETKKDIENGNFVIESVDAHIERITKIKTALSCKTNRALAKKLNIDESTVSRWSKKGWHPSIERLLKLLLDKINERANR